MHKPYNHVIQYSLHSVHSLLLVSFSVAPCLLGVVGGYHFDKGAKFYPYPSIPSHFHFPPIPSSASPSPPFYPPLPPLSLFSFRDLCQSPSGRVRALRGLTTVVLPYDYEYVLNSICSWAYSGAFGDEAVSVHVYSSFAKKSILLRS